VILSHQYRFIYIRCRKTASTSIELALSRICGPDDIIFSLLNLFAAEASSRGPPPPAQRLRSPA
jgi:hypothetical protein